jgi:hypothetical protein
MVIHEHLLIMELPEDSHDNEEACNEDSDHPTHGTVHRLPRLFIGLCPAGQQEIVLGHGGYSDYFFRRPVDGL